LTRTCHLVEARPASPRCLRSAGRRRLPTGLRVMWPAASELLVTDGRAKGRGEPTGSAVRSYGPLVDEMKASGESVRARRYETWRADEELIARACRVATLTTTPTGSDDRSMTTCDREIVREEPMAAVAMPPLPPRPTMKSSAGGASRTVVPSICATPGSGTRDGATAWPRDYSWVVWRVGRWTRWGG
jgi:hypothetical protein